MKTRIIFGFILALTNLTNAITVYTLDEQLTQINQFNNDVISNYTVNF